MSLDKSLKSKGALERHRNVLTRAERIENLKEEGRWSEEHPVFGLPKIAHRKTKAGAKEKKEAQPEEAAEGEAPKEADAGKS
ncbi:MAG: small basic protein [Phycisphaerae bacterium]